MIRASHTPEELAPLILRAQRLDDARRARVLHTPRPRRKLGTLAALGVCVWAVLNGLVMLFTPRA